MVNFVASLHERPADAFTRHLMTGIGAYCYIVWGIWLRHCLNERQDEYRFVWPRFYHLPEVVRVMAETASNGPTENGLAKKTR